MRFEPVDSGDQNLQVHVNIEAKKSQTEKLIFAILKCSYLQNYQKYRILNGKIEFSGSKSMGYTHLLRKKRQKKFSLFEKLCKGGYLWTFAKIHHFSFFRSLAGCMANFSIKCIVLYKIDDSESIGAKIKPIAPTQDEI